MYWIFSNNISNTSTPAPHPTIVNLIKSRTGLREQMVFEHIFSDIGHENGFDYDFNNIDRKISYGMLTFIFYFLFF